MSFTGLLGKLLTGGGKLIQRGGDAITPKTAEQMAKKSGAAGAAGASGVSPIIVAYKRFDIFALTFFPELGDILWLCEGVALFII